MTIKNKTIMVTGGTGSFGNMFTELVLREYNPKKLIIFSRDELKQYDMCKKFKDDPRLRFFLGDVRDLDRLRTAMHDVDFVVHAAALKQVPALEYNPFEAVRTNILGGQNVVTAACDAGVKKVIALSTDKAANPVNFYGATKLCSDKLFISGNIFGKNKTRLSVVRYGNVAGSRGSVLPLFYQQSKTGILTITDARMTRFWLTLEQAVRFVTHGFNVMAGGEIFVPKIPSIRMIDLAMAIAPNAKQEIIGMRPGEKLHEIMIPEEVARNTMEFEKYFVICPEFHDWIESKKSESELGGIPCPPDFYYSSDTNNHWLSVKDLATLYADPQNAYASTQHTDSLWQANP